MANPTEEQRNDPSYQTKYTEKGKFWSIDGINWYPLTEYYHHPPDTDNLREKIEKLVIFAREYNQIGNQGWNDNIDQIEALIAEEVREARLDELEHLHPNTIWFKHPNSMSAKIVEERIKELTDKDKL